MHARMYLFNGDGDGWTDGDGLNDDGLRQYGYGDGEMRVNDDGCDDGLRSLGTLLQSGT